MPGTGGPFPLAKPQVLRSAGGTATLTTAFDPRRNPSRPGRPPEPAVTGPPIQKELLEGSGGGGNPWIGSLRGGCRSPAAGERRPAGALGPRRVVSSGGCDAPPEGRPGVGEGRRERGAESAEPSRLFQPDQLKSKGQPEGGRFTERQCLFEGEKQTAAFGALRIGGRGESSSEADWS